MSLVSVANVQSITNKLAAAWLQLLTPVGTKSGSPAAQGNIRATMNNLLAAVLATDDYEQEIDMATDANTALTKATAEALFSSFGIPMLNSLNNHCASRGKETDSSIVDLPTFLSYYNGGNGGALFSSMLVPELHDIWAINNTTALPHVGVMSPALQADWNTALTHGMGDDDYTNAFTSGASVDTTKYSEVTLVAEVVTAFSSGTGVPVVTVAGTDHTGATSTTWSGTFTGNNPTAALSGLTITPSVTGYTRSNVIVSSSTGIVVGSVLTINKNKPDQELVVVEAVPDGTHITAVFKQSHGAGATIDGQNSLALTPSVSGRRCRSVSGITITITGHSAGKIRLAGVQDRVGI